ncbi:MAG TPA: hypothetical protein VI756_11720 [Blastocatellia bacterium]
MTKANMGKASSGVEFKVFDPRDPSTGSGGAELLDATVVKQGDQWWMYLAGSNYEDYLVQGYAESEDGTTGWSKHSVFAPPEMKMFDFCVRKRGESFDAIFSRVWLGEGAAPPETGLWWCEAKAPSATLTNWSQPVQIMTAEDRDWHSGPWKPSFQSDEQREARTFIFFDGSYRTSDPGPFPFAFTLGCLVMDL